MTAARTPEKLSYEDFLVFEEESGQKYEWIDGVPYAMTHDTPEHGRLTINAVVAFLQGHAGCAGYSSDVATFIEATQEHTYADALLVCGEAQIKEVFDRNDKSIGEALTNPAVIVEVLSKRTERYDRQEKFEKYKALASFEEYVLIWQNERRIEVRTRIGDQWHAVVGGTGETVRVHGREVAVDAICER